MHDSDRAWLALAAGVAAYDLIATDNERLSDAARRYFKSQPVAPLKVLQAKFGFTVENIVATARIQLGLEHDTDPPGITLETSETAEAQAKGTSGSS